MRFPGLIGGSDTSQSPIANCERTVNWITEQVESPHGKNAVSLLPTPGFDLFATLPDTPVRALFAQNDRAFALAGSGVYELFRAGGFVSRPLTPLATPPTPIITNSPPKATLSTPGVPIIGQFGTPGSTTYGYKVTATTVLGETAASVEGTTATGNATLSPSNYNIIQWTAVTGAQGYKVYRTTGGASPPKLIATFTTGLTLGAVDQGQAGTAETPPTSTTTGGTGAVTYGYKVAATSLSGTTIASGEGFTTTGWATLTLTEYNIITWTTVTNATGYKIWRTTGGTSPPKLIATVSGGTVTSVFDQGQVVAGDELPTILGLYVGGGAYSRPDPTAGIQDVPSLLNTATAGLVNDASPASISSSGDAGHQLFVVSAGHGYLLDLEESVFTEVLNGCTMGAYIDGYFVALDGATSTFRISGLLDGVTWDPTQIAQRTAGADRWLAMIVSGRQIWLFGSQTTEVWYNSGAAPFPFEPVRAVFIEKGIVAPFSLAQVDASLIWLGQDNQGSGVVFRTNGYTPDRVSTHAVEFAMQGYTNLADAYAWTYQEEGHTFYVLTFPSEGATWVYDAQSGIWAERGTWNIAENRFDAYRPQCHAFAFSGLGAGLHLVGDRESAGVYTLSPDVGTDIGGGPIRRLRRAPHLSGEEMRISYRRLELVFETGVGLVTGQGSVPTAMMRMSTDAGRTWGNEHWASLGKIGAYRTRVKWHRLGCARDMVFEVVCTDPAPMRLVDAVLDVDPGFS